jgi:hypothetical protein
VTRINTTARVPYSHSPNSGRPVSMCGTAASWIGSRTTISLINRLFV